MASIKPVCQTKAKGISPGWSSDGDIKHSKKPSLKMWRVTGSSDGVLRPFKAQSHCADRYGHTPRKDAITLHQEGGIR